MKYLILAYGSQRDYDAMAGRPTDGGPTWTPDEFEAMGAFMTKLNNDLAESGELVETRGLTAPVHTRRLQLRDGAPVVTDGPYAETQEVLAGYWVVECDSYDRATEIAAQPQIVGLYELLQQISDNPVVDLNHAVAVAMVDGPRKGLALLDNRLDGDHRLHSVRAHLLELAGDQAAAQASYREAARLATSLPQQRYLNARADQLTD